MPASPNHREASHSEAKDGTRHMAGKMQTRPKKAILLDHIPSQPIALTFSSPTKQLQRTAGQPQPQNPATSWASAVSSHRSKPVPQQTIFRSECNTLHENGNGAEQTPSFKSVSLEIPALKAVPATRGESRPQQMSERKPSNDSEVASNPELHARNGSAGSKTFAELRNGLLGVGAGRAAKIPPNPGFFAKSDDKRSPKADRSSSKTEIVLCATLDDACQHMPWLRQCLPSRVAPHALPNGKKFKLVMPPPESRLSDSRRSASPSTPASVRGSVGVREGLEQTNMQQRQFNGFVVPHPVEPSTSSSSKYPKKKKIDFDMMRTYQNIELLPKPSVTVKKASSNQADFDVPHFLRPVFVELPPTKPKNGCIAREKHAIIDKDILGACDSVCAPGKRRADGGVTTNIKQFYYYQCFLCSFQQQTELLNKKVKSLRTPAGVPPWFSSSTASHDAELVCTTAIENAPNDPGFERFLAHLRHSHRVLGTKPDAATLEFDCDFDKRLMYCRRKKPPTNEIAHTSNGHAIDKTNGEKVVKNGTMHAAKQVTNGEQRPSNSKSDTKEKLKSKSAVSRVEPSTVIAPASPPKRKVSLRHPTFKIAPSAMILTSSASKFTVSTEKPPSKDRAIRFNRQTTSSSSSTTPREDVVEQHAPSPVVVVDERRVLKPDEKYMGVGPILAAADIEHGPEKCPIDGCTSDDYNSRRRCETTLLDFYHHLMAHHVPSAAAAAVSSTVTMTAAADEMRCKWHDCMDAVVNAETSGGDGGDSSRRHLRNSNSIDRLKQHYLFHLGARPFRCALKGCKKAFEDPNRFASHMNFCEKNPLRKSVAEQQQQEQQAVVEARRTIDDAELKFFDDIVPSYSGTSAEQQQTNEQRSLIRRNSVSMRRTYSSSAHLYAAAARGGIAGGDVLGAGVTHSVLPPADLQVESLMQTEEYKTNPNVLIPAWRVRGFEQLGVNEFPTSFYMQYWHVNREREAEISRPVQFDVLDQELVSIHHFRMQFFRCMRHLLLQDWSSYFGDGSTADSTASRKRRADDGSGRITRSPLPSSNHTPNKRSRRESPRSRSPAAVLMPQQPKIAQQPSPPLPVLQRESLVYSLMYSGYSSLSLTWPYFMCQRKVITRIVDDDTKQLHSVVTVHEPAVLLPETVTAAAAEEGVEHGNEIQQRANGSRNVPSHEFAGPMLVSSPPDSTSTTFYSACSFAADDGEDAENSLFKSPYAAIIRHSVVVKNEAFDLSHTNEVSLNWQTPSGEAAVSGRQVLNSVYTYAEPNAAAGRSTSAADSSCKISTSAVNVRNVAVDIDASNDGVLLPENLHPNLRRLVIDAYKMAREKLPPAFYAIDARPLEI